MTDEQLEAMTGAGAPRVKALAIMREAVAEAFTVTADDIQGRIRTRGLVEARQCFYLLARRCTRLSYPELAKAIGRDHSTILSGIRAARKRIVSDPWYDRVVYRLVIQLGGAVDDL
jgi:chromosomal replication initiator protein